MTAVPSGAAAGGAPPGRALAPRAPGRLGEVVPADVLLPYLDELVRWRDQRKAELDRLDEASLRATDPDSYTGDVTLSMALWQAVSDRSQELVTVWDGGRADRTARERIAQLIWGRLDTSGGVPGAATGGLPLSLVEACRLSDALVAQLRARLSFDPQAADSAARIAALRAGLERLRELVKQEPSWAPQVGLLAARVNDVASRAARGGDVATALAQLENDAARGERDLIVTTATRLQLARDRDRDAAQLVADRRRAGAEVAALEHRATAVRELAVRCVRLIAGAPRFAVPQVGVLGPVPNDRAGLDAYLRRLADVTRATDLVERAYAAPLTELEELRGRLEGYRVMSARTGRDGEPDVAAAAELASSAVRAVPCDLDSVRRSVTAYQRLVRPVQPPPTDASTGAHG